MKRQRVNIDREYFDQLEALYSKALAWKESRTEYLTMCEIALSSRAPIEGSEKYRSEAARAAHTASELASAVHQVGKF